VAAASDNTLDCCADSAPEINITSRGQRRCAADLGTSIIARHAWPALFTNDPAPRGSLTCSKTIMRPEGMQTLYVLSGAHPEIYRAAQHQRVILRVSG